MQMEELHRHIRTLALLPETESVLVSCYVNLTETNPGWRQRLQHRMAQLLTRAHDKGFRQQMDEGFEQIRRHLASGSGSIGKGAAVFARGGSSPFFLAIPLPVSLPTWVSVDGVPNISPLIQLKEQYYRYVVLLTDRETARIFEVTLGAVTRELWLQRPKLRKRVGREWTKTHYQNHRIERDHQFIREKIDLLESIMTGGGHSYLILAGDPKRVAEIQRSLPRQLLEKVIDIVPLSQKSDLDAVVAGTLNALIAAEERESGEIVDRLATAFYRDNMAVIGPAECMQSLLRHEADVLIINQACNPGIIRWCDVCGWAAAGDPLPVLCAECGDINLRERSARPELIRLAEASGCRVELISDSTMLEGFGGVGCLLRFAYNGARLKSPQATR